MPSTEPVCPTCGREFETLRGMRVHHTKAHDEVLSNRSCADCGTEFHDPDNARVYCDNCMPSRERTKDRWTYGHTDGTCIECGATFLYYPSEKPGRYGPDCVDDESVSCNPSQSDGGERSVDVTCDHCGESIIVYESKAENQNEFFCDRDCYSTWLSETLLGGFVAPTKYEVSWWVTKERALERDEFSCQRCGASREDLGRNPDVHHRKPVRSFENPDDAHTLDNVVCPCPACHTQVEWYGASVEEEP